MDKNSAGEKVKKERNDEILFQTMCTHSKWANEQTLKRQLKRPSYKWNVECKVWLEIVKVKLKDVK